MPLLNSKASTSSTMIVVVAASLLALGIVMVFSSSASLTSPPITEAPWKNPAVRQALFSCLALLTLLISSVCPCEFWRIRRGSMFQPSILLMVATVGMLGAVLVIGEEHHGAKRWLSLGPAGLGLGFQPSEVAKLALVIVLAAYAAHIGDRIRRFWSGFLPALLLVGLIGGLVGLEDFGTAALLIVVGGCVLLSAGARIWHLLLAALPGVIGLVHLVQAKSYRMERLTSFLDPYADPLGRGYHQIQSLITIASGGWWGRGLGCGVQKYGYLPEGRNDFIFAVICEELGIVGGIAVIALLAILLWHGRKAVLASTTDFCRLVAVGAALIIGIQAAMNIAVVTVSVPAKGIALPLVSAGGSGVILLSILVGMLANVARYRPPLQSVAKQPGSDLEPVGKENAGAPKLALQS